MPETKLADGRVSAYGLACGYIDRDTLVTESGRVFHVDLTANGCTYDVDAYYADEPRYRIDGVVVGWAQFDRLTDARRFKAKLMRAGDVGMAHAACIAAMSHLLD